MSLDDDGNVYSKRWDGQYREEQGLFDPKKDTTIWGNPNVERDFLGQPKPERDFWSHQRAIGMWSGTRGVGGFALLSVEPPALRRCSNAAGVWPALALWRGKQARTGQAGLT